MHPDLSLVTTARCGPRRRALAHIAAAAAAGAGLGGCASLSGGASVVVAGHKVAYTKDGQGAPLVVLQSGLGDDRSPWTAVHAALRGALPVLSFDRPGYGGSGATDAPRDPCTIAAELHALLAALGLPPPYLLVGHSLGGLYQHAFARAYPGEVAGLLLLDPTHPRHWSAMQQQTPAAATTLRLLRSTLFTAAARREFDEQAGCAESLEGPPAQPVPTRLLASTRASPVEGADYHALLERLRDDWLRLTGATRWQRVPDAGHYIQRDAPAAVARAVHDLAALR